MPDYDKWLIDQQERYDSDVDEMTQDEINDAELERAHFKGIID